MNEPGRASSADVSDPATFGEDLAGNFRDIAAIAAEHCGDCADYHIVFSGRRFANPASGIATDRARIVDTVAALLAARAGADDPIDVLIVGSSDTGLLATAAHAAVLAGRDVTARIRYTVVDRCGTPLELCARYGRRHRLDVTTHRAAVPDTSLAASGDVILVHSLFRVVPRERHRELVALLARWLKPGGRVVFSQALRPPGDHLRRPPLIGRLVALMEAGDVAPPEPLETFLARLDRHLAAEAAVSGDYATREDLLALFDGSPLAVLEEAEVGRDVVVDGRPARRRRVIAVLAHAV